MNNWRSRRDGRGFPKLCRKCGEGCEIFTSKTSKNPGRLFHSCPNGSEEVKKDFCCKVDGFEFV